MKYLLFFSVFAIFSYSASAQRDGVYYLQKQLDKKTTHKWDYFEKHKEETPVIAQTSKTFILANGSEVSFLKQDNMPCIQPDMNQFNMPCVKPEKQIYHMPVLKGNESSSVAYIFKNGRIISQRTNY